MKPLYRKILIPLLLVSLLSGVLYSDASEMTSSGLNLPLAYVPGYDDEGGTPFTPPLAVPIWIILSGYCIYKGALGDEETSAKDKIGRLFLLLFLIWAFSYLAGLFLSIAGAIILS
jgi:hypothetical protein